MSSIPKPPQGPTSAPPSLSPSAQIAEASLARDLEDEEAEDSNSQTFKDDAFSDSEGASLGQSGPSRPYSDRRPYQRRSSTCIVPRPLSLPFFQLPESRQLTQDEQNDVKKEERALLRDNQIIPPKARKSPWESLAGTARRLRTYVSGGTRPGGQDGGAAAPHDGAEVSETSALLANGSSACHGQQTEESMATQWEQAVASGVIQTTWRREGKTLARYSAPLVVTFILQYSLTMASIFTVGHLGKLELGATSLATMTANITGYAIYQGLATSLDTLCAQAYGSGRKDLVGLQLQRMVYFLMCVTVPIGIVWFNAGAVLRKIVPDLELAELAGKYLKVVLLGAPGYAALESGKRFVQAQGLFRASLAVLLICAPVNAFLHWLFVWRLGWGFIGAPIAVATTDNLLCICLALYVYLINGRECWSGFSARAFKNWEPMIRLALPGLVMIEAEYLAFEILTLAASYISTTHLAAQSVLSTVASLAFQLPFSLSIAASTRVANLIGATLGAAARTSAQVVLLGACVVGLLNALLMSALRAHIARLFTSDPDVVRLVARVLPLVAAFQLFDALAANCSGVLRGLGRQHVGGWVNLLCYYGVAMPISFGTAFGLRWDLYGLWAGVAIALGLVAALEAWYIQRTRWDEVVEDAKRRMIA